MPTTPARPKPGHSLAESFPELAARWSTNNGDVTALDVAPASKYKAWWVCDAGHVDYQRRVDSVTGGGGCPLCGNAARAAKQAEPSPGESLGDLHPELLAEWATSNGVVTPFDVKPASGIKRYWQCGSCAYEWQATPKNRTVGNTKCPKCAIRQKADALRQTRTIS